MDGNVDIQKINDYFLPGHNIYTRVKPLRNEKLHRHEFLEIFYVLSGSSDHFANDEFFRISMGDAYLFFPQDTHKHIKAGSSKDFLYRDILILPTFFHSICDGYYGTLFDDFNNKKMPAKIHLSASELMLFENLFMQFSNDKGEHTEMLANLIVHEFVSSFLNQKIMQNTRQLPNWLVTLVSELNRPSNFATPLPDLLSVFHYTKPYLCNTFKKHIGMTITDYFNKNRIDYANSLLTATDHSIAEICEMIGFGNISHFYTLYKKYYHKSPRKSLS